ncbi:MAG: hypothetical protein L0210_03510, partial [Rhodospirillales bacterium]|nr:hypothetical protein [Rhodospirillales bacterium]
MADLDPCVVCTTTAKTERDLDWFYQQCPRCGDFQAQRRALGRLEKGNKAVISGWIREQNALGDRPKITNAQLAVIETLSPPGVIERANRILLHLAKDQPINAQFDISDPALVALTYSGDKGELGRLLSFLLDQGLIEDLTIDGSFFMTLAGWLKVEELRTRPVQSSEGFVAMWFAPEMNPVYSDGFHPGILAAGYKPVRVDKVEHAGKIDDEIIAAIRRARFVAADVTGH